METYTTIQGDTWDIIAKKVYSSESYTSFLLRNNMKLIDILVFSEGTIINIPEKPEEESELPAWRD